MPIGRMGTAEEVAGAIFFFASDDSSLCQGSVLSVDGGFTAQQVQTKAKYKIYNFFYDHGLFH